MIYATKAWFKVRWQIYATNKGGGRNLCYIRVYRYNQPENHNPRPQCWLSRRCNVCMLSGVFRGYGIDLNKEP